MSGLNLYFRNDHDATEIHCDTVHLNGELVCLASFIGQTPSSIKIWKVLKKFTLSHSVFHHILKYNYQPLKSGWEDLLRGSFVTFLDAILQTGSTLILIDTEDRKSRVTETDDWTACYFPITGGTCIFHGTTTDSLRVFLHAHANAVFAAKGVSKERPLFQALGMVADLRWVTNHYEGLFDLHPVLLDHWVDEPGRHLSMNGVLRCYVALLAKLNMSVSKSKLGSKYFISSGSRPKRASVPIWGSSMADLGKFIPLIPTRYDDFLHMFKPRRRRHYLGFQRVVYCTPMYRGRKANSAMMVVPTGGPKQALFSPWLYRGPWQVERHYSVVPGNYVFDEMLDGWVLFHKGIQCFRYLSPKLCIGSASCPHPVVEGRFTIRPYGPVPRTAGVVYRNFETIQEVVAIERGLLCADREDGEVDRVVYFDPLPCHLSAWYINCIKIHRVLNVRFPPLKLLEQDNDDRSQDRWLRVLSKVGPVFPSVSTVNSINASPSVMLYGDDEYVFRKKDLFIHGAKRVDLSLLKQNALQSGPTAQAFTRIRSGIVEDLARAPSYIDGMEPLEDSLVLNCVGAPPLLLPEWALSREEKRTFVESLRQGVQEQYVPQWLLAIATC
jgi:hypothetical protein